MHNNQRRDLNNKLKPDVKNKINRLSTDCAHIQNKVEAMSSQIKELARKTNEIKQIVKLNNVAPENQYNRKRAYSNDLRLPPIENIAHKDAVHNKNNQESIHQNRRLITEYDMNNVETRIDYSDASRASLLNANKRKSNKHNVSLDYQHSNGTIETPNLNNLQTARSIIIDKNDSEINLSNLPRCNNAKLMFAELKINNQFDQFGAEIQHVMQRYQGKFQNNVLNNASNYANRPNINHRKKYKIHKPEDSLLLLKQMREVGSQNCYKI